MQRQNNVKGRMMIFAPHPDDETLGCGGTIARRIKEGYDVVVVLMTDGRHAFSKVFASNSGPSPEQLKEIRKEELMRAAALLGIQSSDLLFLDFEDGTLLQYEMTVEEKIMQIMKKYPPDELYFPFIRDDHPDHVATNRIVRRTAKRLGLTCTKYQYIILHEYARIGPFIERILSIIKGNLTEVDVHEFLDVKSKAIGEFRSEFTLFSDNQSKPVIKAVHHFLKKKEVFHICRE